MTSRRSLHRPARSRPAFSLSVVAVGVLGALTACGGSDDDSAPASAVEETSTDTDADAEPQPTDTGGGEVETSTSAPGSGTLTMGDGTTYTFVMTTCDTSENGAEGFVLPDSYDLFGATADDEFRMQFIRAGLDEDFVSETASLEGDFDEDGKNAQMLYYKVVDTLALTVDGGAVSGTVTLQPIGPNRPHGDEVDATVAVSC